MMHAEILTQIWPQVILPLVRLSLFICLGLFIASLIESLNWTQFVAKLAQPLIRFGRLSSVTGASFSIAFISGVSANTMLSEAFRKETINKKELVLANLFNSLPRFFLHLPTVFFLTVPLIKLGAFHYVGLTFSAAILQTIIVVLLGRVIFPPQTQVLYVENSPPLSSITFKKALKKSYKRVKKRIVTILKFLIPIYILFFLLNRYGLFDLMENFISENIWFLSWLNPESLSIVLLHVTGEFSAGLAAASVLLAENSLTYREVVLALLVGNILSTPIRALRHQLPYYTGIFNPKLAMELVLVSQLVRILCVLFVMFLYIIATNP